MWNEQIKNDGEMTDQLLGIALDSPNVIEWLQEQYNQG